MAMNFCFQQTDTIVLDYLKGGEISAVTQWQQNTEYTFEFHFGHDTGNPVYVRPNHNTDTSNLPKIDTKNKYAHQYTSIDDLANGGKLKRDLSPTAQNDIITILQNSWDAFQTLATRFWDGEPVREARTALEIWAEEETADSGQHDTTIPLTQLRKILGGT